MKIKKVLFLFIAFFLLNFFNSNYIICQTKKLSVPLNKQNHEFELGIRYLKLGNTFREAGDFHLAYENLKKAKDIILKYKSKYWYAVYLEYAGFYNLDIDYPAKALILFKKAHRIYDKVLTNEYGSNYALEIIISNLEKENQETYEGVFNEKTYKGEKTNNLQEMEDRINKLESKVDEVLKLLNKNRSSSKDISKDSFDNSNKNQLMKNSTRSTNNNDALKENYHNASKSKKTIKNSNEEKNEIINVFPPEINISKEKELKCTGYSYLYNNKIVDMYGNVIDIKTN